MKVAKLFKSGGSQAVRLPKEFRFEGEEVEIEKRGNEVVLRPKRLPKFKTFADISRYLRDKYPDCVDWPDRDQPKEHQKRDYNW
jgi:antitoxin VapB